MKSEERGGVVLASPIGNCGSLPINKAGAAPPWILDAARDLAMDSAHIPLIADIIAKHMPITPPEQSKSTT